MPEFEKLLKDAVERVKTTEYRLDAHDSQINNLSKSLSDKADKSVADQLNSLKSTLNGILRELGQFDPIRADIETNKKRSDALEKINLSLEERMDFMKSSMNERLRALESALGIFENDIAKLDDESNRQGGAIIKINQRLDGLDRSVVGAMFVNPPTNVISISQADINQLADQLAALKRDLVSFKDEYYKRDKETQNELAKKADKADLAELEQLMRERLEAFDKTLIKTKTELKKALKIIDERIRKLADQANSRGPSLERDDAMLAKKPLEGWKCATCEKGLTNMAGLPADHNVWNRMPRKEPERVPMMGQGFSRMLMTLSHNSSSRNFENKRNSAFYSPREETEQNISLFSSGDDKVMASTSRLERDGSTTLEGSTLPHIKKKLKKKK